MNKKPRDRLIFFVGEFKQNASWSSGNDKVSIISGIHVLSDESTCKYQLMGTPFSTTSKTKYKINFDISLFKGIMSLGILDIDSNTWIKQIGLSVGHPGPLEDSFIAKGKNAQIVLQTDNKVKAVSEVVIKSLSVALS